MFSWKRENKKRGDDLIGSFHVGGDTGKLQVHSQRLFGRLVQTNGYTTHKDAIKRTDYTLLLADQ